ncbi:MAG: nucleotide sugar dehydrogenase, partial [Gammaproteobacteria bacterium]|nr:nucleotide sugar dehydrogenase [Gammaproteobacteria bacterium]
MASDLIARFKSKDAVIGIVGLGYVGLPLALRYSHVGYRVLGLDIDPVKAEKLNRGETYIEHIASSRIQKMVEEGFVATTDFSRVAECDALILCVPTPLNKHREPDISFVVDTMDSLVPYLRPGQVVSLESTTYPGTTEEELAPRIAKAGFTAGKEVFLVFSPEREDPGNKHFGTSTIPKVVGGHTPDCLAAGIALYEQAIDKLVPVSDTKTAEMTKLLEN